ncbi:hypothetical protein GQF56_21370 [Rhodobacter sphaeroides]|jgi:hypothetical protein|uniref:Nucleotidyl transferase AbiEii/AbiGii toxin family protein n=1 Tax=Cereibacter sphaeroides (strain ATCC 17023 / DSM 158 / JCM 6121 / CCUG 31486 / LMG 2827 / NBRC 12203 / NCIMB 8253 / ATH 2.4.1.) TaxID=272943 RepID=Q3IV35_CERS4|nr:hypothetical protein [Cereibacter sphaeroides]ABA81599.1 hypothetical protein RSP_4125 [Cereibacter sphaeroides 2.4.1]AMJ50092.1 hypothetical protein APX01_21295 [Cereibacter sphaeroides]ANS36713.1 hypothetical protein A3858_20840 [Cereibacter sphaeroides]ATN65865.1 hypothetical protein A3857_21320 [Cereibacter sphaeroides]AXC64029.1 hypothetical protein DQL45_21850 [Cereibacter sphaeroides 2.4.1]
MLTDLQARVARIMASNRSAESYFAGGAVLNQHTSRQSDDLTDTDEMIPDIVQRDVRSLEDAGYEVTIDLEIYGCTDATVRGGGAATQIQWMSETRMRFFPLQPDPAWGLRLHRADLAVNKVTAASTRRQARDILDLALIGENYCPLGPLFLGAALKLGVLSPLALLNNARQRAVSASNEELESLRGVPEGWTAGIIKMIVLEKLDRAETFLREVPDSYLDGLPVGKDGIPLEREAFEVRPLQDGGGRVPTFPDAAPEFA